MDFSGLNLQAVRELVGTASVDENAEANVQFYNGDHWQSGAGWIGPWPLGTPEGADGLSVAVTLQAEIKRMFTSRNVIREVVSRHVDGVVNQQVHWKYAPKSLPGEAEVPPEGEVGGESVAPAPATALNNPGNTPIPDLPLNGTGTTDPGEEIAPEDQALIAEAEALMMDWWERREIDEIIQQATTSMLLKHTAYLRIFIPSERLGADGTIDVEDLTQALDLIYLDHPGYDPDEQTYKTITAKVHTDRKTMHSVGLYLYKNENDRDEAEITYLEAAEEIGEALTVIKVVTAEDGNGVGNATRLDMGGHLAHYQMRRRSFLDEPLRSQQKALNLACTLKQRNVVSGGFLERTLLNARLPGRIVRDEATGEEEFIPDPIYYGSGVTNNFIGVTYEDSEGNEKLSTPGIVYRDPVSVDTFKQTEDDAYAAILAEAHQLHYLIAGDATASGESRKQARAAYETDLQRTSGKVQNMVQWILEAVLHLAASLTGEAGRFASLRAYAECHIDPGPLSSDELRVRMDAQQRRLLSRERVQRDLGVEDVDAEQRRIDQETAMDDMRMLSQIDMQMQAALAAGDNPQNTTPPVGQNSPQRIGGTTPNGVRIR